MDPFSETGPTVSKEELPLIEEKALIKYLKVGSEKNRKLRSLIKARCASFSAQNPFFTFAPIADKTHS